MPLLGPSCRSHTVCKGDALYVWSERLELSLSLEGTRVWEGRAGVEKSKDPDISRWKFILGERDSLAFSCGGLPRVDASKWLSVEFMAACAGPLGFQWGMQITDLPRAMMTLDANRT